MAAVRRNNPVLVYGKYTLLNKDNPNVYAYTREWKGAKLLILLNFKNTTSTFNIGLDITSADMLINNYKMPSKGNTLQPYEAAIYRLK